MPRYVWKGTLTFGLVSIPVELVAAEERKEFKFSMLDKRDFSPVGFKRYSKATGKDVEWGEVVKGYEYEKDQYVVMSDEDFRRANQKQSRSIDVEVFVDKAEIAPEFFESPYYLVPGDGGDKVYALLRETLAVSGKLAIGQFVLRNKQHLVAIGAVEQALMLNTLRYADELRSTKEIELPPKALKRAKVTAKEVELAKRLVEDMSGKWNPADFRDTYHQDLMARIREKIRKRQTHEITKAANDDGETPRSAKVIDLAALLKQSLEGAAHASKRGAPRRPKAAKPALRLVASSHAKQAAKRKRA
jgi:DNA end-binding protein Ku